MSKQDFISMISPKAIQNQRKSNMFASVTIAQAILESGWGTSTLSQKGKNLFGIKGVGPAGSIVIESKEYRKNGEWVRRKSSFKKYHSYNQSLDDHLHFLRSNQRYNIVFEATTYQKACYALQQAGYATDPQYGQKLIKIIRDNQLFTYDFPPAQPTDPSNPPSPPNPPLSEIGSDAPSHFAKDAWDWAIKQSITDGSSPKGSATREQVVTMLYRLYQLSSENKN